MTESKDAEREDLRMTAYYFEFEPTGVREIDKILSAVACAGKAHHHTEEWDEDPAYDGGTSFIKRIQTAANNAAAGYTRRTATGGAMEIARDLVTEYMVAEDRRGVASKLIDSITAALTAHAAAAVEARAQAANAQIERYQERLDAALDRAEKAEAEKAAAVEKADELKRENDILRGIATKVMPCHYCGAEEIAMCPYGFPGCSLADDLYPADETQATWMADQRKNHDAAIKAAVEAQREKACKAICPECRKGAPLSHDGKFHLVYLPDVMAPCQAAAIRSAP